MVAISCCSRPTARDTTPEIGHAAPGRRWPFLLSRPHRHIDVFEDLPALNAAAAVGGLHQIVAGLAALLPSQRVDKHQRSGELCGFDEKTSAIHLPYSGRVPHIHSPFGGGEFVVDGYLAFVILQLLILRPPVCCSGYSLAGWLVVQGEENLLAGSEAVNSKFLVQ